MRSATSARAKFLTLVATSKFKNLNTAHHDLTDALAEEKQVYLTMGDKISLYSVDGTGYLTSEGFIDDDCYLVHGDGQSTPMNFTDSVFTVVPRYKYDAQTALNEALERWSRSKESIGRGDGEEEAGLQSLKANEETEENENLQEYKRMAGKNVSYGQIVQLFHNKSGKFLTITVKEVAELEKHCMKVVLDESGNEGSWFMVTPRFKMRAEGDHVRTGDQIVLISKRFHNVYLHTSTKRFDDGRREVNAATDSSRISWRVLSFAPYTENTENYLQIGEVVRLFHKEAEGLLNYERERDAKQSEVFLDVRQQSEGAKKLNNSNTIWIIEREQANKGGICHFGDKIRFKQVATGRYLRAHVADRKKGSNTRLLPPPDAPDIEAILDTVEVNTDPSTVFTIHPLNGRQNSTSTKVNIDSYICLQHEATQSWIHVEKRPGFFLAASTMGRPGPPTLTDTKLAIVGKSRLYDEDAFSVLRVPTSEISQLYYSISQVAVVRKYTLQLARGERADFTRSTLNADASNNANTTRRVMQVLSEMVLSCTISSNNDPFTREGIPIKSQQNLLREQSILSHLMALLRNTFKGITLTEILEPQQYTTYTICRLSYRLLKQVIKGNSENQQWLSSVDEIQFMEEQISFPDAIATLMELFKDNRTLLDRTTIEQISFFVLLLKEQGKDSNFIQFLSILCVCKGSALAKNQLLVCEKLVVENPTLLIPIKKEGNEVFVRNNKGPWVNIEKFVRVAEPQLLSYFIDTINLFSNLCRGRNEMTSEVISTVMTYELVFTVIQNRNLPAHLRTAFCELLLVLYVDVNPHEQQPLVNLTRVWSDLEKSAIGPGSRAASNSGGSGRARLQEQAAQFEGLKAFIKQHLRRNHMQIVDDISTNSLTLSILTVLKNLVSFGFFNPTTDTKEIEDLIPPLIAVLDGRSDRMTKKQVEDSVASNLRYVRNDKTMIVMEAKYNICIILNYISDIRLDHRLTSLLNIFKKRVEPYGYDKTTRNLHNALAQAKAQASSALLGGGEEDVPLLDDEAVEKINDVLNVLEIDRSGELIPILRDLVMYNLPMLATTSGNLLVRHFSQRVEILNGLQQVQILITQKNVTTYKNVQQKLETLRNWKNMPVEELLSMIEGLASLCNNGRRLKYQVNSEHQRILHNLSAHQIIVDMLPSSKIRRDMYELHRVCFNFLKEFCRDNKENQMALFRHLNTFMRYLGRDVDAAYMIKELIKDNRLLASQVTESQARMIVNAIADGCKYPHFIELLENLCIVNGRPLRRNQNMVLKLMIEKQQDTLLLFNTPASVQQRNQLIKAKDHINNPEGLLNYHMKVIDLIGKCARGKIYEAEIKCQSLYSINDVYRQLADPHNLKEIKIHFIDFLYEVYFETEKRLVDIEGDPWLWKVMAIFCADMEELDKITAEDSEGMSMPERANLAVTQKYVFNTILKFLSYFFRTQLTHDRHLPPSTHSLCNRLLDVACSLFDNPTYRQDKWRLSTGEFIEVLGQKGFAGDRGRNKVKALCKAYQSICEAEELRKSRDRSKHKLVSREERVLGGLRRFCKSYRDSFDLEEELIALALVFKEDLNFTRKLIMLLKNLSSIPDDLVLVSLKALRVLLEDCELSEAGRIAMQNQLNELGATGLVLSLITRGNDSIVLQSLKLGIALLRGGNKNVQKTIHEKFVGTETDEALFYEIRSRIRRSISEIKEKQQFYARKLEKQLALQVVTEQTASKDELLLQVLESEDADESFPETGFIFEILRFLQLLCEGHNLALQNYLRSQTHNVKSFDLISETAAYLEALYREIGPTNIDTAVQVFTTLTEYCQGPCRANQFALIRTKLCEAANHILQKDHKPCNTASVRDLKEATLVTLLSLLEGITSPSIPRQMIATLNFPVLRENMDSFFPDPAAPGAKPANNVHEMELPFLYYFLMGTLMDYDREGGTIQDMVRNSRGYDTFVRGTGRIEIVRNNRLERVFFKVPSVCRKLPPESKKNLLWDIKRDNQQDKIEDFFNRSDFLMQEMEHGDRLMQGQTFKVVKQYEAKIKDLSFFLAILINFLIICWYAAPTDPDELDDIIQLPDVPALIHTVIAMLGLVHIVCSVLTLYIFLRFNGELILRRKWCKSSSMSNHSSLKPVLARQADSRGKREESVTPYEEIPRDRRFYVMSTFYLLTDVKLVFYILYLAFSVLGVALSTVTGPFFFSFHLLDVIPRSELLKYVIKSVTQNGKSILLTVLLALVIVYIYSIFGFLFFRDKFVVNDESACESIFQCLVTVVNYGLRSGGGIGDILLPPRWTDAGTLLRVSYDSTFFFVVIVLLLNIIFGIIIDTFGELRALNKAIEFDIKNKCFICGMDRYTFDRHAEGFEQHIENDHNMWHYLYFIMYLKIKETTEYTGPEQYVHEMHKEKDLSFIPNLQALCLNVKEEEEEQKSLQLAENIQDLHTSTQQGLQLLSTSISSVREHLASEIESVRQNAREHTEELLSDVSSNINRLDTKVSTFATKVDRLIYFLEEAERQKEFDDDSELDEDYYSSGDDVVDETAMRGYARGSRSHASKASRASSLSDSGQQDSTPHSASNDGWSNEGEIVFSDDEEAGEEELLVPEGRPEGEEETRQQGRRRRSASTKRPAHSSRGKGPKLVSTGLKTSTPAITLSPSPNRRRPTRQSAKPENRLLEIVQAAKSAKYAAAGNLLSPGQARHVGEASVTQSMGARKRSNSRMKAKRASTPSQLPLSPGRSPRAVRFGAGEVSPSWSRREAKEEEAVAAVAKAARAAQRTARTYNDEEEEAFKEESMDFSDSRSESLTGTSPRVDAKGLAASPRGAEQPEEAVSATAPQLRKEEAKKQSNSESFSEQELAFSDQDSSTPASKPEQKESAKSQSQSGSKSSSASSSSSSDDSDGPGRSFEEQALSFSSDVSAASGDEGLNVLASSSKDADIAEPSLQRSLKSRAKSSGMSSSTDGKSRARAVAAAVAAAAAPVNSSSTAPPVEEKEGVTTGESSGSLQLESSASVELSFSDHSEDAQEEAKKVSEVDKRYLVPATLTRPEASLSESSLELEPEFGSDGEEGAAGEEGSGSSLQLDFSDNSGDEREDVKEGSAQKEVDKRYLLPTLDVRPEVSLSDSSLELEPEFCSDDAEEGSGGEEEEQRAHNEASAPVVRSTSPAVNEMSAVDDSSEAEAEMEFSSEGDTNVCTVVTVSDTSAPGQRSPEPLRLEESGRSDFLALPRRPSAADGGSSEDSFELEPELSFEASDTEAKSRSGGGAKEGETEVVRDLSCGSDSSLELEPEFSSTEAETKEESARAVVGEQKKEENSAESSLGLQPELSIDSERASAISDAVIVTKDDSSSAADSSLDLQPEFSSDKDGSEQHSPTKAKETPAPASPPSVREGSNDSLELEPEFSSEAGGDAQVCARKEGTDPQEVAVETHEAAEKDLQEEDAVPELGIDFSSDEGSDPQDRVGKIAAAPLFGDASSDSDEIVFSDEEMEKEQHEKVSAAEERDKIRKKELDQFKQSEAYEEAIRQAQEKRQRGLDGNALASIAVGEAKKAERLTEENRSPEKESVREEAKERQSSSRGRHRLSQSKPKDGRPRLGSDGAPSAPLLGRQVGRQESPSLLPRTTSQPVLKRKGSGSSRRVRHARKDSHGGRSRGSRVVDEGRLAKYGLSAADVTPAVARQESVDAAAAASGSEESDEDVALSEEERQVKKRPASKVAGGLRVKGGGSKRSSVLSVARADSGNTKRRSRRMSRLPQVVLEDSKAHGKRRNSRSSLSTTAEEDEPAEIVFSSDEEGNSGDEATPAPKKEKAEDERGYAPDAVQEFKSILKDPALSKYF